MQAQNVSPSRGLRPLVVTFAAEAVATPPDPLVFTFAASGLSPAPIVAAGAQPPPVNPALEIVQNAGPSMDAAAMLGSRAGLVQE